MRSHSLTGPALEDNPLHPLVPTPRTLVGTGFLLPAPLQALPSSSTIASPAGPTMPAFEGQGDVLLPASQAPTSAAIADLVPAGHESGLLSANSDLPPQPRRIVRDPLATLTTVIAHGTWHPGPQGSIATLSALVTPLRDRRAQLSSLSLERVLDRQALVTGAPLPFTHGQGVSSRDLVLSAQRRPVATGLRKVGVHPAATQYLQQPYATRTLGTVATASATPVPSAAADTQSRYTVPATPSPTPVTPPGTMATSMQGGNAQTFWITGYTWTGSRTATGTIPHWGTVAVDPRIIPLGSTVYIQGLGVFHAEDTGGAVIGRHVDVFVGSTAEAYQITGYRLVSYVP